MNPAPALMPEYLSPGALWITLLAIAIVIGVHILATATRDTWRRTGARLNRDLPLLKDDPKLRPTTCEVIGHIGPMSKYAGYRICLACNQRQDNEPYDQDLDRTDLSRWDQEMTQ